MLLHVGHVEALSRTSERASAPFPMPLRRGVGWNSCLTSIFKMWPEKDFVQEAKNTGGKGREGSFQVKQHPTGFIGSANDIIFSTEPGV